MKSEFFFIIYGIAVFLILYFIFNDKSKTVIYDIPVDVPINTWGWGIPYNYWPYWTGGYNGGYGGGYLGRHGGHRGGGGGGHGGHRGGGGGHGGGGGGHGGGGHGGH